MSEAPEYAIAGAPLAEQPRDPSVPHERNPLWLSLSPREHEIALALARGLTNREIAAALGISIKTVDTHRGHVLKKMKLKNNVALCRWCIRAGLTVDS